MDILAESAVRVTVLAVGVAIVLRALRIRSPWLAHAAWTAVVVIMLLLPVAVAWGPQFAMPLLPSSGVSALLQPAAGDLAPLKTPTNATVAAATTTDTPWHITWGVAIQAVYFAGVGLLLARLSVGLRRSRVIRRGAVNAHGRLTHPACVTPITVGVVAPAVILPADWASWNEAELSAVLDHEEEHVRRRDPLVAVVALFNRAIFWFHPLAWWLPQEISRLSEQACDAAVIARGHDSEVYSSCLLRFARRVTDAGRRIAPMSMAMPGAGLRERLGVLARPEPPNPSRLRLASAAVSCAALVVVCAAASPTAATEQVTSTQTRKQGWAVETSEHFDILHNGMTASRVSAAVRNAEAAYAQLSAALKHDLSQQITMVLVQRDRDLTTAQTRDFVLPSGEPARSRVVISLESLDHGAGILLHELTHQFAFDIVPDTSRLEPLLIEGLADYERGTWNREDLRRTLDAAVSVAVPPATSLAATDRHWAHLVFDCVDSQRGAEGVRRLLFALRARQTLDQALPMAFGIAVDQFNQGFRQYVTTRSGQL